MGEYCDSFTDGSLVEFIISRTHCLLHSQNSQYPDVGAGIYVNARAHTCRKGSTPRRNMPSLCAAIIVRCNDQRMPAFKQVSVKRWLLRFRCTHMQKLRTRPCRGLKSSHTWLHKHTYISLQGICLYAIGRMIIVENPVPRLL